MSADSGQRAAGSLQTCALVKKTITEWAQTRSGPFPYLRVGEHLTTCVSCLAWSTELAHQPASRYLADLRLRLSDFLALLGASLLAVWSANQEVKIRFCVEPEDLPGVRNKALKFLRRYEGFSPETRAEAQRVSEMLRHSEAGGPLAQLEPYELVRYFFRTALELAAAPPLSVLTNLGIVENYQAAGELQAGHLDSAHRHFLRAREYFGQVTARERSTLNTEADRTALVSAQINLAGTEVLQADYSELALYRAIDLLYAARRSVVELGLNEAGFTTIFSNLLISYLRLFLKFGVAQGYELAQRLSQEVCATPGLGPAFLKECIRQRADAELITLLGHPKVKELHDVLQQQAAQELGPGH